MVQFAIKQSTVAWMSFSLVHWQVVLAKSHPERGVVAMMQESCLSFRRM